MKQSKIYVALCLSVVILSGCATFQPVPFDQAANSNIHTIALVTPNIPDKYTVGVVNSVAGGFGLIGGLIQASEITHKSNTFTAAISKDGYAFSKDMIQQLVAALTAAHYNVVEIQALRQQTGFLDTYPATSKPIDAYLDVEVAEMGYLAAGSSTNYYPHITINCRLVDSAGRRVLYKDRIIYDPIIPVKNVVTITPSESFKFSNFDDLMNKQQLAIDGLKDAVRQSAITVVQGLQ